ncbi:MAG: hypothetical protein NC390_02410 [Fusobacterium sp.]|nr:hypothetical protein [Fusobacterium sp.]
MKINKTLTVLGISGLLSVSLLSSGFRFPFFHKAPTAPVVTSQGYESVKDSVWCVTFQLVWNDFMDKFTHGKPVQLAGGNPPIADELNKKLYTEAILSPDSYYKTQGEISQKLKKQIEKEIYKKFHETSDVLNMIDWSAKDSYLFYAMLKKDFAFLTPFNVLDSAPFAGSAEKVKYFGINKNTDWKVKENVEVLYFNGDEYAVKLLTKENEEVILLKSNKDGDFTELYNYVTEISKPEKLGYSDTLKVPNFNIDKTISYDELCNKQILGTNQKITKALQTIKFKMDNKGGSLKSEAVMSVMRMSLAPDMSRHFNFDEPFVLFLKEQGKDKPYFATRVENTEFLVKEK